MADDTQTTGQGAAAGTGAAGVVVDKNKSAEKYMEEASKLYIVPPLVRKKFTDLVKLIYETESMNEEEREYWLQIMPIMTEEQIVKFRDILVNEKNQLAKIDNEYDANVAAVSGKSNYLDEVKMKEKMEEIKEAETSHEKEEKAEEDALLSQLQQL